MQTLCMRISRYQGLLFGGVGASGIGFVYERSIRDPNHCGSISGTPILGTPPHNNSPTILALCYGP